MFLDVCSLIVERRHVPLSLVSKSGKWNVNVFPQPSMFKSAKYAVISCQESLTINNC